MNYAMALNLVIDDGISAARIDYIHPYQKLKLDGSIQGFEDCRNKQPQELAALLKDADKTSRQKMIKNADDYWFWRCRTIEIEWVCNVMSCILEANGLPKIISGTARGMMKAAEIIGVQ